MFAPSIHESFRAGLLRARAEVSTLEAARPRTACEAAAQRDRMRQLQRDIAAARAALGGDA